MSLESDPVLRSPETQAPTAREAIRAYQITPLTVGMGEIDHQLLRSWYSACQDLTDLSLPERRVAAEICIEYACGVHTFTEPDEITGQMTESLGRSRDVLREVVMDAFDRPLLAAQACVEAAMAKLLQVWIGKNSNRIANGLREYQNTVADTAHNLLRAYQKDPDAETLLYLQTLTLLKLANGTSPFANKPPALWCSLPGLSRCAGLEGPAEGRFHALVWDMRAGTFTPLRIGMSGPEQYVTVPANMLRHDGRDVGHADGLLGLATKAWQSHRSSSGSLGRMAASNLSKGTRGRAGLEGTRALYESARLQAISIQEHTKPQSGLSGIEIEADLSEDTATDAIAWYTDLPPHHAMGLELADHSDSVLVRAVSETEIAGLAGGQDADTLRRAADIRTELAFVLATQHDAASRQNAMYDFGRAGELFSGAAERYAEQGDEISRIRALCAEAAMPVFAAIAYAKNTPEMSGNVDQTREEYSIKLVGYLKQLLGMRRQEDTSRTPSDGLQNLNSLMLQIAACVVYTSSRFGFDYLAAPSLQRQQGDGGWDVSVWPPAGESYRLPHHGRLRIATTHDPTSVDRGVVTVTPKDLLYRDADKWLLADLILSVEDGERVIVPRAHYKSYNAMLERLEQASTMALW